MTWLIIPRAGYFSNYESLLNTDGMTGTSRQQPLEMGRKEQHVPSLLLEVHLQAEWSKMLSGPMELFLGVLGKPACLPSQYVSPLYLRNCLVTRLLLAFFSSKMWCCILVRVFHEIKCGLTKDIRPLLLRPLSGISALLGKTHEHEGRMIFAGVWFLARCLLSILKLEVCSGVIQWLFSLQWGCVLQDCCLNTSKGQHWISVLVG